MAKASQPPKRPRGRPRSNQPRYVPLPQPNVEMLLKAGSFPMAQGRLLRHIFDFMGLGAITRCHLPSLGPFNTSDSADCLYLSLLGMLTGEYNGMHKLGEYSRRLDVANIFEDAKFTADSFNRQAQRLIERIALYGPSRFAYNLAGYVLPTSKDAWAALTDELFDELDLADELLAQQKDEAQAEWDQYWDEHGGVLELSAPEAPENATAAAPLSEVMLNAPRDPSKLPDEIGWVTITPQALAGIMPFMKAITLEASLQGVGSLRVDVILAGQAAGLPVIVRLPRQLDEVQRTLQKQELNLIKLKTIEVSDADGKALTVQAGLDPSSLELLDRTSMRTTSLNLMVVDASEQRLRWREEVTAQSEQELREMTKVLTRLKQTIFPSVEAAQAQINEAFGHMKYCYLSGVTFVAARAKDLSNRTLTLGQLQGIKIQGQPVIDKQACLDEIEHRSHYVLAYSPTLTNMATVYNLFHNKVQSDQPRGKNKTFFTNHYYLIEPERLQSLRAMGTIAIVLAQTIQDALSAADEE